MKCQKLSTSVSVCDRRNCWVTDSTNIRTCFQRMCATTATRAGTGASLYRSPLPPTPGALVVRRLSDHRWRRIRVRFSNSSSSPPTRRSGQRGSQLARMTDRIRREASLKTLCQTMDFAADPQGRRYVDFILPGRSWGARR